VIPAEGSLKMPYVIGPVKGAPRPDAGKKLIDYVLSDEGQKIWAGGFVQPIRAAWFLPRSPVRCCRLPIMRGRKQSIS